MSALNAQQWREISPYLDHALSLPEEDRLNWLDSFRASKPALAELLQNLLEEHRILAKKSFLERPLHEVVGESFLEGQTIGAYTLISPIGHGGMGSVWLAQRCDGRFERRVAVKFLRFAVEAHGAERFRREGRILGQLAHPHIAELIDAGVTSKEEPYLVLEYVEGQPIDQYCDQRGLEVEARILLFIDVASAVAYAHANLIVHRDIKPSNVLVRGDGQVKLLDFGIAKLLGAEAGPAASTLLTIESGALTPQFAAPEQVTGQAITTATDVYGLGVLLYLLLTGQHPAGQNLHSAADLIKAIVDTEPLQASSTMLTADGKAAAERRSTTPDKLRRLLGGDLDTIVGKALKKNPMERYASVTAFAEDLRRYLHHEIISARPETLTYRAAKFIRRNRASFVAAMLTLTAITTGSGMAIYQERIAQRRFQEVRKLAHTFVFDLHDEIAKLEGSTKAREMMVLTGLEYLDNLARNAGGDLELQKEIAAGYMKIGDAEGYPTKPNLGQMPNALASYQKAGSIYRQIAAKNPAYLPDLATYYMKYAGLVRFTHDRKQARELSESAIQSFDQIRSHKPLDGELELAYTQAWCTLGDLDEDMAHYRQAYQEFRQCGDLARSRLTRTTDRQALSWLSQADERIGTAAEELGFLQEALRALDEDDSLLIELRTAEPQNPSYHRRQALLHHYRSEVYDSDFSPSYGDATRGLESARRYLDAAEEMVRSDPANTSAQFSRAVAMYWASFYLREFDPKAAVVLASDSVRMFDAILKSGKHDYLVTSRRIRALLRLGEAQLKAGRLTEARATAQEALEAERPLASDGGAEWSDEHSVLVQLLILAGNASAVNRDYRHAEEQFLEARAQAQSIARSGELTGQIPLANAERALGAFYARRHRLEDAHACYQSVIDLWQRFPEASEYLGRERLASREQLGSIH